MHTFRRGGEGPHPHPHPACCNKCCPTPNAIYLEWLTKWSVECRAHLRARVVRLTLVQVCGPRLTRTRPSPPTPTYIFRPSCSVTTFHLGMSCFDYTRRGSLQPHYSSIALSMHLFRFLTGYCVGQGLNGGRCGPVCTTIIAQISLNASIKSPRSRLEYFFSSPK